MKLLILAIRPLLRFRTYTFVNIIGLALSLTCFIIISRYVYSEWQTDHFYPDPDRVFTTIYEDDKRPGEIMYQGVFNPNKEKAFNSLLEHPGVECASEMRKEEEISYWYNENEYLGKTLIADSNFFHIARYPLLAGTNTLSRPEEAVITEMLARKIFGNESALGKQLRLSIGKTVTITGVVGAPATASSIEFDLVISEQLSDWQRMSNHLVRLHPEADYRQINRQYNQFMLMEHWKYSVRYQLYPLSEVYLNKNNYKNYFFRLGNPTHIYVLSVVALMILLVGIFNFINIYSVVILKRGREWGMKKVFGAGSLMMFAQLYLENVLMMAVAILLGWVFIEAASPLVQNQLGLTFVTNSTFDLLLNGGILFLLPLFTSLMPFIRYRREAPIVSLRSVNRNGGSVVSRKLFLVVQYIITITLIVCSLFFIKQLKFMLDADPGFRIKDVIACRFFQPRRINNISREEWEKERERKKHLKEVIQQRLDASPLIEKWTYGPSPIKDKMSGGFKFKVSDGEFKEFTLTFIAPSWLNLFNIEVIEGKAIDPKEEPDLGYDLYLTESGKKLLGITDIQSTDIQPERRLWFSSGTDMDSNPPYRILGVVKDFTPGHWGKFTNPPIIVPHRSNPEESLLVIPVAGHKQEVLHFLEELHKELFGGSFEYSFIEDEHKALYQKDRQLTVVYSVFALIAILISSLGLFSLSLFDVQQRFREIAIRKVNGATTSVVMRMLLIKYYKLLGIAFLIASPIAGLAINRYLEDFAHKAPVSWWIFAVALLITAGISLATLIWQIRKAARTNPAEAIKAE